MEILSKVGGTINVIVLVLFICFVCFINSRDKMRLVQLNISICLLFGTVVILISDFSLHNQLLCKMMALSTQFLFLSAFVWKLILGINAFRGIVLLKYQQEDWMLKRPFVAVLSGYSIPLAIVSASGGLNWQKYGKDFLDGCWIQSDIYLLWFLIPITIILFLNCIFLFLIGKALFHNYIRTRKTKVNESQEFLIFLQLMMTMGITWVTAYFGIFFLWAKYIFVICFPLQGLMMFLFVVIISQENRSKLINFISTKYSSLTTKSSSHSEEKRDFTTRQRTNSSNLAVNKILLSSFVDETEIVSDEILEKNAQ
uniref:GCR144 n=1 Tax=Schmidtea mediterranea TaxID=79327 RepID=A0A193KUQ6_SCHMD|nr:GCR144 [Schmidtea mediterranea]